MDQIQEILKYPIVQILLSIVFSSGIVGFISRRKINNYFDKKLENHKSQLAKEQAEHKKKLDEEIRKTEYEIQKLFNKVSMVQQKEFEVLPEAWVKFYAVYQCVSTYTASLKSVPDLSREDETFIVEYLTGKEWSKHDIEEYLQASDRHKYYLEHEEHKEFVNCRKAIYTFYDYIQKNKIFLRKDLKEEFEKAAKFFSDLVFDKKHAKDEPYDSYVKIRKKMENEAIDAMARIEKLVQAKLQYDKAL
ncbi:MULTISPECIES: hypothetical protein [unclassified Maridesulfovibrio]|uniref:hypothetical protein n=1 Tax=unclassified Maridesulfovibrio TaxID=2794999 RepID=UPI003B3E2C46